MRSKLPIPVISAARALVRLALVGVLALTWAGSAPADFSLDPHDPAPIGFERADAGQAILAQRLSGTVAVRADGRDGGRTTQSGDSHPAIPPAEPGPQFLPQHGLPATSVAHAPAGWAAHGYHARAPPAA